MIAPVQLDAEALALFARKGTQGGPGVPQAGEANAVKVRRVMALSADLSRRPLEGLRILDLGCGEGVYAIEAAIAGAEVLAIDARSERMDEGAAVAERHGITGVRFEQRDVRELSAEADGVFDVVWCLGLLYHLDAPDLFELMARVREMCGGVLIADTLIAPGDSGDLTEVEHSGRTYSAERHREHADDDPPEARRARLLRSIDNAFALRLTRESLLRALADAGFSSVLECGVPLEPGKAADRITLAALCGEPVPELATYPWINGRSEEEIAARIAEHEEGA